MANRKIVIVNPTNDSDKLTFDWKQMRVQDPYPEYERPDNGVKETITRMDSEVYGRRVFSYGGINVNHWNIKATLHLVTQAEEAKLVSWYSGDPPVVKFSLDGTTFYWAIFLPGGCDVQGYKNNEQHVLAAPWFNMVTVNLAILTNATAPA